MAFTENLDVFFGDFSDTVSFGNKTISAILEQPDELIADDVVMTTDYQLTAKNSDLGTAVYGSTLKVNGDSYSVRSVRKIDDGSICVLSLTKS